LDVGLSENEVFSIWEPVLDAAQNWNDTVEVDVTEFHCVHICSFPRIPWTVYETESSLPIYVEEPTTYLYKEVSS
jgi:hypothetical protein